MRQQQDNNGTRTMQTHGKKETRTNKQNADKNEAKKRLE